MQEVHAQVQIRNMRGLHARASAQLVKCAQEFEAEILVEKDGLQVSALSIMGLMMLAAGPGCFVSIHARGHDAGEAVEKVCALIDDFFGEGA
ncbi:MAG: HPr family phosphocarrier protein [Alphaproteobacteria bacterium]|nr:HPr family phosphocarrier protein [Alphaproteobacteria bacterium]